MECDPRLPWVSEINKQLLLSYNNNNASIDGVFGMDEHQQHSADSIREYNNNTSSISSTSDNDASFRQTLVGPSKGHRRTMSDIPQFDEDAESMDSYSLDTSIDPEVVDIVQFLVDSICEDYEDKNFDEKSAFEMDEPFNNYSTKKKIDENAEAVETQSLTGGQMFNQSTRWKLHENKKGIL